MDHEEIEGFMPAMTMPYQVQDGGLLEGSNPGDLVTATLVVEEFERLPDYTHDDRTGADRNAGGRPRIQPTSSRAASSCRNTPLAQSGRTGRCRCSRSRASPSC